MTCEPSLPRPDQQTLFAEDSPARTSLWPDVVLASKVSEAVSGRRWPESSELCVRDGSLRKMYQPFEVADLPPSFKISTRSGTMRSGTVSPLPPLVRLTDGIGSGSLPTPKARDHKGATSIGACKDWNSRGQNLPEAVVRSLFTTPTADDTGHRKKKYAQGGTALSMQAGGNLNPTWVEWLMGYPTGWTELSPSEIQSSRK